MFLKRLGNHSIPQRHPVMRGAFTIVEGIIVVLAVGILAMVVFPQFHTEKQQAREGQLKDELRYLRTQIMVFRAQHQDIPPGYPDGNTLATPTPENFEAQMTRHTNLMMRFSYQNPNDFPYGPYLAQIPANPINGLSTCKIIGNNAPLPPPDGATGWIYKPQTQEIIANVMGADQSGTSFCNY